MVICTQQFGKGGEREQSTAHFMVQSLLCLCIFSSAG